MSTKVEDGYCVIPPYILKDTNINPTKKILLSRVLALSVNNPKGFCFSNNNTLARNIGLSERTVRRHISQLETLGYIELEYNKQGFPEGGTRRIYPVFPKEGVDKASGGDGQKVSGGRTKSEPPPYKTDKGISTRISNRSKGDYSEEIREVFEFWKKHRKEALDLSDTGPSVKLTEKRERKIRSRLEEGYTVNQLKEAILGCMRDEFNRDNGYVKVSLIFRNQDKVDQYRSYFKKQEEEKNGSDFPQYQNLN